MPSEITPADRDLMTRLIMAEVDSGDPDTGRAAVAHVVLNRVAAGGYGNSATAVMTSRGAFEPMSTRRREMMGYSQNSPEYRRASDIVDGVISGAIPDPTNGALHFMAPSIEAKRNVSPAKQWWRGHQPSAVIGGHAFYNDIAGGNGERDAFAAAGLRMPGSGAPAAPQVAEDDDSFSAAGLTMPTARNAPATISVAAPASPNAPLEVPLSTELGPMAKPVVPDALQQPPSAGWLANRLRAIRVATDPVTIATDTAKAAAAATAASFSAGQAQAKRGVADIFASRPATGFGELAAGTGGMLFSPVSGAIQAGVEQPVAGIAGPEAGARAGLVAGLLPVGGGVAKTANALAPSTRATSALVEMVGPENVPNALARLQSNPDLSLMDVSPGVRKAAQGLIASPEAPAAQRVLEDAVAARQAARTGTIRTAYDEALGPAPNVRNIVDSLKEAARIKGREAIRPALDNAKPVDTSPVIAAIDAEVRPGIQASLASGPSQLPLSEYQQELQRLRYQLVNPETGEMLTDAGRLHDIQSRLGDMAYRYQRSPDGKTSLLGSQLRGMNEKLIDAIDAASGGAYRPARAQFKDAKDVEQAFADGFDTMKTRASLEGALEDTPDALRAWMVQATPEETAARQLGVRAYVAHEMGRMQNEALAGTNVTKSDYSKDKLRILFGQKEGDKLVQSIEDARLQADTNAKLVAGSKTAETQAAERGLAIRPVQPLRFQSAANALLPSFVAEAASEYAGLPYGVAGLGMLAAGGLTSAARKAASVMANRMDIARNTEIARQASATGPARSAVINALAAHPAVLRARGLQP